MFKKYIILVPLCLAACASSDSEKSGPSVVEDRGLGGAINDQGIRFKIQWDLVDYSGYDLTVYKGRVLLFGVVESEKAKADILRIVKNVAGVKEVIDRMNVKGPDGFAEYTRDAWITAKLKAALLADENVNTPSFVLTTFDKIVYIFGTAQNQAEMQRVLNHASEIAGVRKVVNLIDIKGCGKGSR